MMKHVALKFKIGSPNGIQTTKAQLTGLGFQNELAEKPSWYWNHDLGDKMQLNKTYLEFEIVLSYVEGLSLLFDQFRLCYNLTIF